MNDSLARIEKLEIELAHLQRVTEQLNQVVADQSREMLRLTRTLDLLSTQLTDLRKRPDASASTPSIEDEKPPHY